MDNKKVLLREHKRHTDHSVSSTTSVVLYWGGGYPIPPPARWGTPPPGCGQTDRHVSKHNLPSYYVRGR